MQRGVTLVFYVEEKRRHGHELVYEWLLHHARQLGVSGGSALRAVAGFGRHGLHEQSFFELAGELPVVVHFVTSAELADKLLELIRREQLNLFCVRTEVEYGFV